MKKLSAMLIALGLLLTFSVPMTFAEDATGAVTVNAAGGGDYTTIKAALDVYNAGSTPAATDYVIIVEDGTYREDGLEIVQQKDKNLVLKARNAGQVSIETATAFNVKTQTIRINGDGRYYNQETLLIDGFNIGAGGTVSTVNYDCVGTGAGASYNYLHNVTIRNCNFYVPTGTVGTVVAFRMEAGQGGINVTLENCVQGEGFHSFAQAFSLTDFLVKNCTGGAINTYGGGTITIENSVITTTEYAIRVGSGSLGTLKSGYTLTVKNCNITASASKGSVDDWGAIVLRGGGPSTVNIMGTTFNLANTTAVVRTVPRSAAGAANIELALDGNNYKRSLTDAAVATLFSDIGVTTVAALQAKTGTPITGDPTDPVAAPEIENGVSKLQMPQADSATVDMPVRAIEAQLSYNTVDTVDIVVPVKDGATPPTSISLPASVFEAADTAGKAIQVEVTNKINGSDQVVYAWTFDKAALNSGALATGSAVNLAMDVYTPTANTSVGTDVVEADAIVLHFAHHGALPGEAAVRVYVGHLGHTVGDVLRLFYYNESTKALEEQEGKSCTVDGDGYVIIQIDHCSDYVLQKNASGANVKPTKNTGRKQNPNTGIGFA